MFVVCVTIGATMSWLGANVWVVTVISSLISSATAVVAAKYSLKPAGSIFFVFATAAVGSMHGGSGPFIAFLVAAVTAGFCVVLGAFAHIIGEGPLPGTPPMTVQHFTVRELGGHGLRFFIAPLIAGSLGTVSTTMVPELSHSYWAMVAAVAPISPPRYRDRLIRSAHRIIGTLPGVATAAFLLSFPSQPWQLVVWMIILQFLGEMYVGRNYAFALTFITPVALMMTQLAHPMPTDMLLLTRSVETILGAGVAMFVVAFG